MVALSDHGRKALDDFIDETIKSKEIPGFVVGVSDINGEIYFRGAGTNVVDDPSSGEVNPDSVFWICSQTKFIASLAALILIDKGKLSESTPAADFFPELRNPIIVDSTIIPTNVNANFKRAQTPILVKHLLNQSSGMFYPGINDRTSIEVDLPAQYVSKELHSAADPASQFLQSIIGDLPGFPILFEPGTDFVYGWSCDVLGFIVEKVSGQSLEEFCQENIFRPLGMKSSFLLNAELREKLVDLAFRNKDGSLTRWANQLELPERDPEKVRLFCGGVGIYSSLRDYLKLLHHIMQIHEGVAVPNAIVSQSIVRSMSIPTLTEKGSESLTKLTMAPKLQWGNAMAICTQDTGNRKKGTLQWSGWAHTHHFIDFESGISVVIGTQVAPNGDVPWIQKLIKLEAMVYASLGSNSIA